MEIDKTKEKLEAHIFYGISWASFFLFIFSTPIQIFVGSKFYSAAYQAIKHKVATMDVLISIGSLSAYIFSIISVLYGIMDPDYHVTEVFETSGMVDLFYLLYFTFCSHFFPFCLNIS